MQGTTDWPPSPAATCVPRRLLSSFLSVPVARRAAASHFTYPLPARAQILILLQDDQVPPGDNCKWLQHLFDLFDHWPRLGAVGLRSGTWMFPWDVVNEHFINMVGRENNWAQCRQTSAETFAMRDPVADVPFHFVTVADFAPYAMRAEAFKDIGAGGRCAHFAASSAATGVPRVSRPAPNALPVRLSAGMMDEAHADPGECGIVSDWEISKRFWNSGWQARRRTRNTHRVPNTLLRC